MSEWGSLGEYWNNLGRIIYPELYPALWFTTYRCSKIDESSIHCTYTDDMASSSTGRIPQGEVIIDVSFLEVFARSNLQKLTNDSLEMVDHTSNVSGLYDNFWQTADIYRKTRGCSTRN